MKMFALKSLTFAAVAALTPVLIPVSALAQEAEEKHSAGMPQLDVSTFPSQIFWLAVTFVILFIFFRGRTLPEISGVLEKREGHIHDSVAEADNLRRQAQEAKRVYESTLEQGRIESSRVIAAASDAAKDRAARRLWEFHERSGQEIAAMEKRMVQATSRAMQEMNTLAAGMAADATEKLVGIDIDRTQAMAVISALTGRKEAV
jgi:F-type H+-transporting ATPase subunit b